MVTIVMRDALRAQVERASQGRQTVLYTAKGQPSYMSVVPLVTLAALGLAGAEGPHPAFIVGGRERGEFFYGSYGGVIRAGELVSLPGVAPGAWMDFAGASDAAGLRIGLAPEHQRGARRADAVVPAAWSCGAGQHRQRPLHPRARGARQRVDGRDPGRAGRSGHADRQRSGALAARHGPWHRGPVRQPLGMAGRAAAGGREIQIIPDNDAVQADLSSASADWRALRLSDGALVAPGHPDSAKFDACRECREGNAGAPMLRSRILHRNGPAGDNANHPALMDAPFGQIECDGGGARRRCCGRWAWRPSVRPPDARKPICGTTASGSSWRAGRGIRAMTRAWRRCA